MYLNISGRFSEAAEFFQKHSKRFYNQEDQMTSQTRIGLYYARAYSCFAIQDYQRSLHAIQNVIGMAATESEVYNFARLLSILIYYETRNWAGLEYATRSAYRHLLKTERLFRTERIFLAFIRRLPAVQSGRELINRFTELLVDLDRIFRDSSEADIEYYIHIRAWLRSKIGKTDFAECVKQQAAEWMAQPDWPDLTADNHKK
jgi:tetratricopeptide (TPR) repeat protein